MVSPGVRFLAAQCPKLATFLAVGYLPYYAISTYLGIAVSNVAFLSVAFGSLPVIAIAAVRWTDRAEQRRADALGADRLKVWNGKWFGNIDVLMVLLKRFEMGYPSACGLVGTWDRSFSTI